MTTDQLKASISTTRLLMTTALNSKQRDLIGGVLSAMGGARPDHSKEALLVPVEQQAIDFEAGHPKIAQGAREVMDSLNKMGI
ncbi:MAG: hypothetical protein CL693_13875 [Cellvibrionaceae bacterium]|nr:hypothetical protein [Cellvibrionaceae bacterium]